MPYPYPSVEGLAPLDALNQRLLDVTVDVPQVPYGGVLEVGDLAVSLVNRGKLTWVTFGTTPLEGERLRHAIHETVSRHGEAGVPNNEELAVTLPFAHELVVANTVHAVDVLRGGDDAVETPTILPIDIDAVMRTSEFLAAPANRRFVRTLFGAARTRLNRTDVPPEQNVVAELERYRPAIAAISQQYYGRKDQASQEAKQAALGKQRGMLMSVAGPAIHEALRPFAERRSGVMAFAGALACAMPSAELFAKHPRRHG